jgi:hypothetical protein
MKHRVVLIVTFVLLIVLFTVSVVLSAGNGFEKRSECRLQGAWVSSFYGPWDKPLLMQETLTPLDPAGKKMAYFMHLVNPDATFAFPFPPFSETDYLSDLVGEAVRTGLNSYDFSLIGYGVKEAENDRGDITYIWTVTGTVSCVDGENKTDIVNIAVYLGDQDADKDGYPDEGEEPFLCTPTGPLAVGKRVPQMPACVPSEMES